MAKAIKEQVAGKLVPAKTKGVGAKQALNSKITAEQAAVMRQQLAEYRLANPGRSRMNYGTTIVRGKTSGAVVDQLPKQARLILTILDGAKGKTMTQQELVAALQKVKDKVGVDFTRQEPARIYQFYRGRLVEGKHIECR